MDFDEISEKAINEIQSGIGRLWYIFKEAKQGARSWSIEKDGQLGYLSSIIDELIRFARLSIDKDKSLEHYLKAIIFLIHSMDHLRKAEHEHNKTSTGERQ